MKRSLKKYDDGGKTKKPVFSGKLNNRVVSDNTSVQRPTIQQQDVRLKTPQEVKKANRENFQKRIGVKPTYNVQELTDFGTPEPGIEDASLEALDALSLASGVGYLGKKGLQVGAKGLANVLKSKPKFNSEIDWAKWNKEIPENPQLMKEYNTIEQSTKKAGSWMKNPDGSAFQGTPEQFVQQNSENFKKAFSNSKLVNPDGSPWILEHGSPKKFDTFDESKFQLGDAGYSGSGIYTVPPKGSADSYTISGSRFHTGAIEPTTYKLYGQGNNPITSEELIKLGKNSPAGKEMDLFNFHRKSAPLNEQLLNYDVAIHNQNRGVARVRDLDDAWEVVFPTNKQLKSAIGNNGMFDMTNPNIYKSIAPYAIPTAIGAGALQQTQEQPQYPTGGKVNTLEGDLISKVIMNRNRDKNFVNRAYAVGQNPGMFTLPDTENFGDVMSHKMAWGTDDAGQAYMYPTIMNPNNEAIKVPNQYADYISSDGYKKETNMEYGKGGYTVKRSSDRKGKTHVVIGPDGTKKYFGDPNLGERGKSKYGKDAFYARHKKNLDANPYFRAYARATWEEGGMIPEQEHISMNKRSLFKYGGLTVTDLNKYQNAGVVKPSSTGAASSATKTATSSGSGSPTPSPTGATVSGNAIGAGIGFGAEMIGGLIPEKQYADDEGADLGSVKSIGESTLEYGAKGAAVTAMLGGADFGIATALGAGYGAYKGWADKEEMEEKQKEANFKNSQRKLSNRMNNSVNFGNANINTSQEMQFAQGGMVLDYDDPNANAELELQETFQMPNGQVGMVDGPSHENGGIAVDLPEGTRIWSDKLKYGGKTFAKHTKPITSKIARLEKEIEEAPINSEAKRNSVMLLNKQLDHYFDVQETNKEANEMKRTFKDGGMIKRADGSYSKRGLWDNIRANKGSGKKPTPQMLEQERKIKAKMEMGGYMYGQGGTNNPGFRALPEEVQQNILANMAMGGQMYAMGGSFKKYQMAGEVGNPYDPFNQPNEYASWADQNRPIVANTLAEVKPLETARVAMAPTRFINQVGSPPIATMPQRFGTGNYGEFVRPQVSNPNVNIPFDQLPIGVNRPNTKLNIGEFGANANQYIAPENLTMGDIGAPTPGQSTAPGFFNKAGQFIQNNPGLVGQLGTAALTAGIQSNRINSLARPRTLADVRLRENVANPNLVDYSAERQAYNRMGLNAMGEAQRGFGSSAAAQAFKNKARLNTLEGTGKSYQAQENANAQIRNQFLNARQEAAMKEAMMNNEIGKYNLENVYGYDTMTTAQKNAITAMLANTAGQTFGKQTDYKNQMEQAKILSNQYDNKVYLDVIANSSLEDFNKRTPQEKEFINRRRTEKGLNPYGYGGMMGRSFRKFPEGGTIPRVLPNVKKNYNLNTNIVTPSSDTMNARQYSDFVPQAPIGGFSKEEIQAGLAGASFIPGIGYGASLVSSGISLLDAANAKNSIDRAKYLGEAAIGVIPYGKAVQTLVHGSNLLKATEGLHKVHKGLAGYHASHPLIHAEGGTVGDKYRQAMQIEALNKETIDKAALMDQEYTNALAGNQDIYKSSVTGLDYKVIRKLPKSEKRAMVTDMWRETHGEAPSQKQIESGVKAIEGKKVSSVKAKEVANVANSQESMQDMISKKWTTGTYTPTAPEPEGPSMMERGEQFYEEQMLPAARTLKKNFKEGVEKGYDDLKDVYGKAKAMGKQAYASLENADYSGLPDASSNARMQFEGNKIIQEDLDDMRKTVIPSSLRALAKDISNKNFGTKFKIDETHFTKSQLAEIEKLATGKLKESELSKSTASAINSYNDYNKFSSDTTTVNKNQFSDTKNIRNSLGKFNPENKDSSFVIKEWYDFNEKGKNTEDFSFDEWYEYWKNKGYSEPLAAVRSIGSRFGSAPGENNTPIDVKIKKRSLKK